MPTHALQLSQLHIGQSMLKRRLFLFVVACIAWARSSAENHCIVPHLASPSIALLQQSSERKGEEQHWIPNEDEPSPRPVASDLNDGNIPVEDINMAPMDDSDDLQTDVFPNWGDAKPASEKTPITGQLGFEPTVENRSGSSYIVDQNVGASASAEQLSTTNVPIWPDQQESNHFDDSIPIGPVLSSYPQNPGDPDSPDESDVEKKDMKKMMKEEGQRLLRPNHGKGPETVRIGVWIKTFDGVHFADRSFKVDLVVVTRWHDKRALKYLEKNADEVNVPLKAARKLIWMPEVEVINRVSGGMDLISSVVRIASNGHISKILRLRGKLMHHFQTETFPYDEQDLSIKLSTRDLMVDQAVLKGITHEHGTTGVDPDAFEGRFYTYVNHRIISYKDNLGPITKSNIDFQLKVQHAPGAFLSSILIPLFATSSISLMVNFIPVDQPAFMMPRVGLSFFGYLMQVIFAARVDGVQPERKQASWLDVVEEYLRFSVYSSVVFNMIISYTAFTQNEHKLANRFDKELRVIQPVTAGLVVALCWAFRGAAGKIWILHMISSAIADGLFIIYIISMVYRIRKNMEHEGASKAPAPVATPISLPLPTPITVAAPTYAEPAFTGFGGYAAFPNQPVVSMPQAGSAVPVPVQGVGASAEQVFMGIPSHDALSRPQPVQSVQASSASGTPAQPMFVQQGLPPGSLSS